MSKPNRGEVQFDVAARNAHVLGGGPRIEPIPNDEVDAAVRRIANETRAAVGAGEAIILPEYFRTMAKHPALFACQMQLGTAIFLGRIPPRQRELAVLRIGLLCRAPYEWGEHVRIAQRYGVTPEEIERVKQGSSADGWSRHDRAIVAGVEELIADQALDDGTYADLAAEWSEEQVIEYLVMVGSYVSTAFVQNSLRLRLADDNPGLPGPD